VSVESVINPANLDEALTRAASLERLLVITDFDGTIAELVDDPETAIPVPKVVESLEYLASCRDTCVALVSGRGRADLLARVGAVRRALAIGSYGAEWGDEYPRLTPEEAEQLDAAVEVLRVLCADFAGAWVERKPVSAALHTRRLTPGDEARVVQAATGTIRALGLLSDHPGKHVVEFIVGVAAKGRAALRLAGLHNAKAIVVLGDDVADEQMFASARPPAEWVTIHVGSNPTSARFRVKDPHEAAHALAMLAAARAAARG